ncbi:MAG TPA: kynureninase [Bacteroidales bacterium]|nr:kynureninase [Bacteroidales bacterium]
MNENWEKWKKRTTELDREDPLREFRDLFSIKDKSLIYFDGNSLGMLPLESEKTAARLIGEEWGERLIRGWNENWWEMPARTGEKLAGIIGAEKSEVIICDSTSVNLYKLASAALRMRPGRRKIVSDDINFPSDLYIIQGIIDYRGEGHMLELAHSQDGISVSYKELAELIDNDTALVVLTYVSFRSAYMYDMNEITDLAHSNGALVIWDLCHAAGAVPVELNRCNADMAVGCTYKYLNGGPGSPAFMYVRKELQKEAVSPVWGWLGEKDPFEFSLQYRPAMGIRHYLTGSPNILSLCTLEPSLDIFQKAGMDRIRTKSIKMTGLMLDLYYEYLEVLGFRLGTPADSDQRGSHISFKHTEAFRICKALLDPDQGDHLIIPDFRPPDNIRFGLAPLYNTFSEIFIAVCEIERIVKERIFLNYDSTVDKVT